MNEKSNSILYCGLIAITAYLLGLVYSGTGIYIEAVVPAYLIAITIIGYVIYYVKPVHPWKCTAGNPKFDATIKTALEQVTSGKN